MCSVDKYIEKRRRICPASFSLTDSPARPASVAPQHAALFLQQKEKSHHRALGSLGSNEVLGRKRGSFHIIPRFCRAVYPVGVRNTAFLRVLFCEGRNKISLFIAFFNRERVRTAHCESAKKASKAHVFNEKAK